MARTCFAVAALTTRVCVGAGGVCTVPSAAIVSSTRLGWTRTPSLAIVAKTLADCTALTLRPWPKAIVGIEVADQSLYAGTEPLASPGKFSPVGSPMPNFFR